MHMLTERLQILVSPEQRRRLEDEAERRGTSVAGVVREAVDAQLDTVCREDRIRAVEEIAAMRAEYLPPDELNRMIEEQYDDVTVEWRPS